MQKVIRENNLRFLGFFYKTDFKEDTMNKAYGYLSYFSDKYPATKVDSGFCIAIKSVLLKL